jgi:hypothetical protein
MNLEKLSAATQTWCASTACLIKNCATHCKRLMGWPEQPPQDLESIVLLRQDGGEACARSSSQASEGAERGWR